MTNEQMLCDVIEGLADELGCEADNEVMLLQIYRLKQIEKVLASFPGFVEDCAIGDPWIEAKEKALRGDF